MAPTHTHGLWGVPTACSDPYKPFKSHQFRSRYSYGASLQTLAEPMRMRRPGVNAPWRTVGARAAPPTPGRAVSPPPPHNLPPRSARSPPARRDTGTRRGKTGEETQEERGTDAAGAVRAERRRRRLRRAAGIVRVRLAGSVRAGRARWGGLLFAVRMRGAGIACGLPAGFFF